MASIRHFSATHPLPDWRNFGVILRVLLGGNGLAALAALLQTASLREGLSRYVELAAAVEPALLVALCLLAAGRNPLWRLPLRAGQGLILLLAGTLAYTINLLGQWLIPGSGGHSFRAIVLGLSLAGLLLTYFELRSRAYSPVQAEARLAALNARIRPHFLFNSLNAVLSLIRARPQQAEAALESLSDLFRAAMRDPGEGVKLEDEIALGQQYLELEKLRLGERLAVDWQIGDVLLAQPIPPLMLQPLLENAVYHGIEPAAEGGTVRIRIDQNADQLIIRIDNPAKLQGQHAAGNRMALDNIRERLSLYYDLEARLDIEADDYHHEVCITLPCRQNTP